jgi:predicted O-methyltransferase YrrM
MYFTEDWFSKHKQQWHKSLKKYITKKSTFLEIGCFEGKCSTWLLENILKHRDSKLYCIDHFLQKNNKGQKTLPIFKKNVEKWENKVVLMKGYSYDILKKLNVKFDFIYVDASRHSKNVLEDTILSWHLLKPSGLLIIDDYTNNKEHDVNCPRRAIDSFMDIYANELEVVQTKWQVVLKKRRLKLQTKPCYSEQSKEPLKTPTFFKNNYTS